jgi:hypothetical protein
MTIDEKAVLLRKPKKIPTISPSSIMVIFGTYLLFQTILAQAVFPQETPAGNSQQYH